MDGASFERVYDNLQDFHAFFAASFGRKQWREHSRNYLQGLLVQAGERRNAENLSESGHLGPGGTFSDRGPVGRCRGHRSAAGHTWPPGWLTPRRTAATFPSRDGSRWGQPGRLRQAGEGGQLPGGDVPGLRSDPLAALVDKRLYLPELDYRCAAAGVPEELELRGRRRLAAGAGPGVGPPQGRMGCRGRRLRDVAVLCPWRAGDALRAGRSGQQSPWSWLGPVRGLRGPGAPATQARDGQRRTMEQPG